MGADKRRESIERYRADTISALDKLLEFLRLVGDEEGWVTFNNFKNCLKKEKEESRLLHMIHIIRGAINEIRDGNDALNENVNSKQNLA